MEVNKGCLYDLNEWIFNLLTPIHGRILELGCGTGKFMQLLTQRTHSTVIGIDISSTAVQHAALYGSVIQGSFDDIVDGIFDLIISIYAIYYSKDMVRTIVEYKNRLSLGGRIFLVGPGADTNHELVDEVNRLYPNRLKPVSDFLTPIQLDELSKHFDLEIYRLNNRVELTDDQFSLWWHNHNMFSDDIADIKISTLTKNVMGILLT